ncbi:MAG: glycerate kinase [Verrucomicrobiae bacterium]|nr:glycerate kinase [Verrucomicrobiae bacterium]
MDSLKVLIAPDKFKGTLTATEAAMAIKKGWKRARPHDDVAILPASDGGDGFGEVMSRLLNCKGLIVKSVNAAHEECLARCWINKTKSIAIVESARVIGLAMLPTGKYHPFQLDTFGLGIVLKKLANKKPENIFIGLGGSATNDGGFGMARALGYKFISRRGIEISKWTELADLKTITPPSEQLCFNKVVAAVDVKNLLLGKKGASRIYGPQKGLKPDEIPFAEKNLRRLVAVVRDTSGADFSKIHGSGAAGGLGFGLMAFLNARVESGFEIFSHLSKLEVKIKNADIVITGEGSCDRSSLMGKGAGEIARLCQKHKKPCIMLAGRADVTPDIKKYFSKVLNMMDICGEFAAVKNPSNSLEKIAETAAKMKFEFC